MAMPFSPASIQQTVGPERSPRDCAECRRPPARWPDTAAGGPGGAGPTVSIATSALQCPGCPGMLIDVFAKGMIE